MAQFNIDPEYLAERVEAALKRQKKNTRIALTAVSIGLFILFNAIGWGVLFGGGVSAGEISGEALEQLTGGMILMDIGWFLTLIYMLIPMLMELPSAEKRSRARITSQIMGEVVQESLYEGLTKPKRKRQDPDVNLVDGEAMTIGEDGELVPDEEVSRRQTRR